jgi:hydrogenase nickel incorporation protein HypB
MCDTCGCSQPDEAVTFRRPGDPEPDHHHHHDHDHPHTHDHDHPHTHDHDHAHTVKVEQDILSANNLLAERNRGWFEAREILALNLVSSPGSGKTTLLERTITDLKDELPITVIEGDQQTLNDAERIAATGAQVLQVNTGQGCHLDAPMIRKATRELDPPQGSLLMIENVGNLVCPALFDLGEAAKVVRSRRSSDRRGKSGLRTGSMPGNARPWQREGKCRRKQTARRLSAGKGERVR